MKTGIRKFRGGPSTVRIRSPWVRQLLDWLWIVSGTFVIAVSFNVLLLPNQVASGGVVGLSVVVDHAIGISPAVTQWGLNILLFLLGFLVLGGKFGIKTVLGTFLFPTFVLVTSGLDAWTSNPLLAAIYGGFGIGAGIGLVLWGKGSTGGTDLGAQLLHRFTGFPVGGLILVLDGLVIVSAGVVFSPEQALYALLGLMVTSRTIDIMQSGFSVSKAAIIISSKPQAIRDKILHEMDRGVTLWKGTGGFSGEERELLWVVISQNEVTLLRALVQQEDPNAFMTVCPASEVFGEGFMPHNMR